MATEPTNAVLEERIKQLTEDFNYFRKNTKSELKDMEAKLDRTSQATAEVNRSIGYIEKTVSKMDEVMTNFINVVNQQNSKIDDFVNSDNRMNHKKQFVVSVLQVVAGIVVALISIWGAGKL